MALRRIIPTGETRTSRSRELPDMLLTFKVFSRSVVYNRRASCVMKSGPPLREDFPAVAGSSLLRVDVDTATPENLALTPRIW
jgi:hypothetical protein